MSGNSFKRYKGPLVWVDPSKREAGSGDSDKLEQPVSFLVRRRKSGKPNVWATCLYALSSFNIQPTNSFYRHLRKAGFAESAESAIASDWARVFQDAYVSFLKNAQEVERDER